MDQVRNAKKLHPAIFCYSPANLTDFGTVAEKSGGRPCHPISKFYDALNIFLDTLFKIANMLAYCGQGRDILWRPPRHTGCFLSITLLQA